MIGIGISPCLPSPRTVTVPSDPLAELPARLAWLDAEYNVGSSSWGDRQSNGFTATLSGSPTIEAAGFGGKPSVLFDGVDDHIVLDSIAAAAASGTDKGWTIIMAIEILAVTSGRRLLGFGNSASASSFHELQVHPTTAVLRSARTDDAAASITRDTTETLDTNRRILTISFTGTTIITRRDGVALTYASSGAQDSVNAVTINRLTLMANRRNAGALNFLNARVADALIWASSLSNGDMTTAENELKAKHGIA